MFKCLAFYSTLCPFCAIHNGFYTSTCKTAKKNMSYITSTSLQPHHRPNPISGVTSQHVLHHITTSLQPHPRPNPMITCIVQKCMNSPGPYWTTSAKTSSSRVDTFLWEPLGLHINCIQESGTPRIMIISLLEHILKVFLWDVWMGISNFPTDPKLSTLTSPQACRAERAPTVCLENPHVRRSLCGKSLEQDQKRGRKSMFKKTKPSNNFQIYCYQ